MQKKGRESRRERSRRKRKKGRRKRETKGKILDNNEKGRNGGT